MKKKFRKFIGSLVGLVALLLGGKTKATMVYMTPELEVKPENFSNKLLSFIEYNWILVILVFGMIIFLTVKLVSYFKGKNARKNK